MNFLPAMATTGRDRPDGAFDGNGNGLSPPLDKQGVLLEPKDQPRGNACVILSAMDEPRAKVVELDDAPR
jgi:hypothetical protein